MRNNRPLSSFGLPAHVLHILTTHSFQSSAELIRFSPTTLANETGLSLHDATTTLATINAALGITHPLDIHPRSHSNTPRSPFPPPPSSTSASSANSFTPPTNSASLPSSRGPPALAASCALRSGCHELDLLLSCSPPLLGLLPGHLYEIAGVPGIGLTTLCMQLCTRIALTPSFGGLNACALYIDTESGLLADRMAHVALATAQVACDTGESFDAFASAMLDNILVYRTFTLIDLIAVIELLPTVLRDSPSIRLIVVDSLSFPCEGGKLEHGKAIMAMLRHLAMHFGLIVVVTSKVHTYHPPKHIAAANAPLAPAALHPTLELEAKLADHCPMGMDVWSDKAHVVACLFWDLDVRVGFLYKGMHPNRFARFRVTEKGIEPHNCEDPSPPTKSNVPTALPSPCLPR